MHREWRHPLWLGLLVAASVAFSLGLACAVPFAAFAVAAALSLSRRDALILILLVCLANQLVGFTVLHYPWTLSTFTWGVVLGAVAVLATWASQWIAGRLVDARHASTVTATFLIAFLRGGTIRGLGDIARRDGNLYRGDPRPDLRDQRRGFCRLARAEPSRHIRRARQQAYGRALDERAARLGRLTAAPGLD